MIFEVLLPLPIKKTFYYTGVKSNEAHKAVVKGSLVEVNFKKNALSLFTSVRGFSSRTPHGPA